MDNEDKAPDYFSVDFWNTDYVFIIETVLYKIND